MNRLILYLLLLALFGCAGSSGPTDEQISTQVTECLKSLEPTSWSGTFDDAFEIQSIQVKDRLVKSDQAKVVATLTVRLKNDYRGDLHMVFQEIVPTSGDAGSTVTTDKEFTFDRYEKGWRLQCGE